MEHQSEKKSRQASSFSDCLIPAQLFLILSRALLHPKHSSLIKGQLLHIPAVFIKAHTASNDKYEDKEPAYQHERSQNKPERKGVKVSLALRVVHQGGVQHAPVVRAGVPGRGEYSPKTKHPPNNNNQGDTDEGVVNAGVCNLLETECSVGKPGSYEESNVKIDKEATDDEPDGEHILAVVIAEANVEKHSRPDGEVRNK